MIRIKIDGVVCESHRVSGGKCVSGTFDTFATCVEDHQIAGGRYGTRVTYLTIHIVGELVRARLRAGRPVLGVGRPSGRVLRVLST